MYFNASAVVMDFNATPIVLSGDNGLAGRKLSSVQESTHVVMVSEGSAAGGFSWHQRTSPLELYPDSRSNVGFVDGHVKFIKIYQMSSIAAHNYNPPAGYEYLWSET